MATVSWDIVRKVVEAKHLDCLCVWSPGKAAMIYEAEGGEAEVLEGLSEVQAHVAGDVLVECWKSGTTRKGKGGYVWTVGSGRGGGGVGAMAGGGPSWESFMNLKIEHETLKLRNELEGKDDGMGGLGDIFKMYAPIIAKSVGLPGGVPAVGAAAPVNGEGVPPDLMREMLSEVAIFAKGNPDKAREYLEFLKTQNGTA